MKDRELFKKIKKLHWFWFWSGNWPLLDVFFQRDAAFEKEFSRIGGVAPRASVDFFQNGLITAYHCQEEYDRLGRYFRQRFARDPMFILCSFRDYKKITDQDMAALGRIGNLKHAALSHKELARLFLQTRKHFVFNGMFDHYASYIEKFFAPELEQYLHAELSQRGLIRHVPEYMAVLVTPRRPTKVYEERVALFKILKDIRRNKKWLAAIESGASTKKILASSPALARRLQIHLQKYNWLPVLVNNPATTLAELWREVTSLARQDADFKVESRRLGDYFDKKILAQKRKIISQLKPDRKTKLLIRTMEETAYIRTEDNAVMSRSSYLVIPLYREIAKRLGLTYSELKELAPDDIVVFLRRGERVPPATIRARRRLTCFVVYRGMRRLFTGETAKRIKHMVDRQVSGHISGLSIINGTPASLGRATGTVLVARSSKEAGKLKRGDILVAPATSADFVPAMRKAGAIITELGGLTSHAAVVAREFKIPCLVGVALATRHLKTGDRVAVDAEKGIVKKL